MPDIDDQGGPAATTRREALATAGAVGLGAGAFVLLGCADDEQVSMSGDGGTISRTRPQRSATTGCTLTPEQTEGPFFIADSRIRRDITEGKPGAPLQLRLRIRSADECEPLENATVELWHTDASGEYSGVDGSDGTFLRGGQRTGRNGMATFDTIFPGWYPGRAPHLHVKVHIAGDEVHTGQLYFRPEDAAAVYSRPPYNDRGKPDTTNATDGIFPAGGDRSLIALSRRGDGYLGRLDLNVST